MKRYIDFSEWFRESEKLPNLSNLIDTSANKTIQAVSYLSNIEYSFDKDIPPPKKHITFLSSYQTCKTSPKKAKLKLTSTKLNLIPNVKQFNPRRTRLILTSTVNTSGVQSTKNHKKKAISFNFSLISLPNITSPKRKTFNFSMKKKKQPITIITSPKKYKTITEGSPIRGIIEKKCENIVNNCKTEIKGLNVYSDKNEEEHDKIVEKNNEERFEKKNLISLINFKKDLKLLDDKKREDFQTIPSVEIFNRSNKLVQKSKYVSRIDSNLAYHAKNVISDLFDISDDKQKNQSSFNSTIKYQKRKISEMENLIDKNVTANIRCRQYLSKVNGK